MAVGEHVVSSMWMNSAALSIEKLLDDILRVLFFFFFFSSSIYKITNLSNFRRLKTPQIAVYNLILQEKMKI
jgi:hypothetical protein